MNYKKLLLGWVTVALSITSLTSIKQASAFERANDRVNIKSDSTFLVAKKAKQPKQQVTGKLSDYARQAFRNIKTNPGKGKVYQNDGGHGGTKLPGLSRGERYVEHDVINPKVPGDRGTYRIVTKVNAQNKLVSAYYTGDHYKTFQKLN